MSERQTRGDERERLIGEVAARVEMEQWFGADVYRVRRPARAGRAAPKAAEAPAPGEDADKRRRLEELCRSFAECHQCPLGETRTHLVFGTGRSDARLMFVGEAPGRDEDAQGEPFVGLAGKLLTKMIVGMGLERKDVYIGNVLKCRPPENRAPTLGEMAVCLPYVLEQIDIIRPQVVCALGATALKGLLRDPQASIGRMRGRFLSWRGCKLMPTYHPAYLLRAPREKRKVWEDLQKVMAELGLPGPKGRGGS